VYLAAESLETVVAATFVLNNATAAADERFAGKALFFLSCHLWESLQDEVSRCQELIMQNEMLHPVNSPPPLTVDSKLAPATKGSGEAHDSEAMETEGSRRGGRGGYRGGYRGGLRSCGRGRGVFRLRAEEASRSTKTQSVSGAGRWPHQARLEDPKESSRLLSEALRRGGGGERHGKSSSKKKGKAESHATITELDNGAG
ncbi:hypothetical protein BDK51DRAFT_36723, partial [Blyttiomyces helicus]